MVGEKETGATKTMTEDRPKTPDLRLLNAEARLAIAVLRLDVKSTPTYLPVEAGAGQIRYGVDHPLPEGQDQYHIHDRVREPLHDEGSETMIRHDPDADNIRQVDLDLELLHVEGIKETEEEGVPDAVMIEIDP